MYNSFLFMKESDGALHIAFKEISEAGESVPLLWSAEFNPARYEFGYHQCGESHSNILIFCFQGNSLITSSTIVSAT